MVLPTCLGDGGKSVYIRVSVVPVDVPMLVSRQALLDLGAIMDIPELHHQLQATWNFDESGDDPIQPPRLSILEG